MTPLEAAYAAHDPGSQRFLDAVDFAGRYQVTRTEARRIALESESAAVRERTWKDETWWKDAEEESVADGGEITRHDSAGVAVAGPSGCCFSMYDGTEEETRMKIVLIHSDEGYSVSVPSLPGCCSQGNTEAEAIDNIKVAIQEYLSVKADLQRRDLTDGGDVTR